MTVSVERFFSPANDGATPECFRVLLEGAMGSPWGPGGGKKKPTMSLGKEMRLSGVLTANSAAVL